MNFKFTKQLLAIFFLSTCLISCGEIKTDNPKKAYKYWAGTNPPSDLKLLKAQYWQSSHWTKEYIFYLKFIPTRN